MSEKCVLCGEENEPVDANHIDVCGECVAKWADHNQLQADNDRLREEASRLPRWRHSLITVLTELQPIDRTLGSVIDEMRISITKGDQ